MDSEIHSKVSPRSVPDTVERLRGLLEARHLKVFDVIDQRAEAESAGLTLRETVLVLFGNPAAGTPVMAAVPLAALDLPLKLLVWDDEGTTRVSYLLPQALSARHHLSPEQAAALAGIGTPVRRAGRPVRGRKG